MQLIYGLSIVRAIYGKPSLTSGSGEVGSTRVETRFSTMRKVIRGEKGVKIFRPRKGLYKRGSSFWERLNVPIYFMKVQQNGYPSSTEWPNVDSIPVKCNHVRFFAFELGSHSEPYPLNNDLV